MAPSSNRYSPSIWCKVLCEMLHSYSRQASQKRKKIWGFWYGYKEMGILEALFFSCLVILINIFKFWPRYSCGVIHSIIWHLQIWADDVALIARRTEKFVVWWTCDGISGYASWISIFIVFRIIFVGLVG